jgi:hypothetical protein
MTQIASTPSVAALKTGTEQEQSTAPVASVQAFAPPHKVLVWKERVMWRIVPNILVTDQ